MLDDIRSFWNEFAPEYYENQLQSRTPIAENLLVYLLQENILPATHFLDLAGGSGRYLKIFEPYCSFYDLVDISDKMLTYAEQFKKSPHTQLILSSQEDFFLKNLKSYDVVFSAMNPALDSFSQMKNFAQIKAKEHLILRMNFSRDSLFSPYESLETDLLLPMSIKWLKQENISYTQKNFSYSYEETIPKAFFQEYFNDKALTEKVFGKEMLKTNQILTQYTLLRF